MRRNDHDVTDRIRTTDLKQVSAEVARLYKGLYNGTPSESIERAFADIQKLYAGEHPEFQPCDTEYHDIQHVLDVTLALPDGPLQVKGRVVEASRDGEAPAGEEAYMAGIEFLALAAADEGRLRAFLETESKRRRVARTPPA